MTSELKAILGDNIQDQTNQSKINAHKDKEKKKKDFIKKQTGMKRELIKLIGGVPSIVERAGNKGSKASQKWVWAPFTNPARKDNLKLLHWQRAEDLNKNYDFSQLNQSIEIIDFSKEEYDELIKPNDRNWNYEQTCYLWDLIKRFELRFTVIKDRFDEEKYGERTVESLKDRYYSIARIILEHRKMFEHPIIKSGYNYEQEMKRRTYIEKTMNKSFAELREENSLFEMAENLNKKIEKNEKFEKYFHQKLDELQLPSANYNNQLNTTTSAASRNTIQIPMAVEETENTVNINNTRINNNGTLFINSNLTRTNVEPFSSNQDNIQTFEDFIKNNITKNDSFVYLRSQKLKHNLPVSEKIQERVNNYMNEFNIQQKLIPTAKVEIAYDNLRNNIILYTSLKKYLEKKDKEYIFLQNKFKECQNNKNPPINQSNNNTNLSHQPTNKLISKSEKNISQFTKTTTKSTLPTETKEHESKQDTLDNNMNNTHNLQTRTVINNISGKNMALSSANTEINNSNANNNTNTQESNKPQGQKEKRRKINGTPKVRKRRYSNEDAVPINEEKEQKSNSKKKKKGTK